MPKKTEYSPYKGYVISKIQAGYSIGELGVKNQYFRVTEMTYKTLERAMDAIDRHLKACGRGVTV